MRKFGSFFWLAATCTVLGVLGGVLIGWLITLRRPEIFTASSTLRVVPSKIPSRFVPATPELTVESVTDAIIQDLDSKSGLASALQGEGLLDFERASMTRDDYFNLLRQRIDIRVGPNHTLLLSNSDEDRERAIKMNHALVSHVMSEIVRDRGSESKMALEFLRERVEEAALHWEKVDEELRKAAGAKAERMRIELSQASREYDEAARMTGEATTLMHLETRKLGPTLEVVDLSSAPESPTNESHKAIYAVAAVLGGVAGLVGATAMRIRLVWSQT